MRHQSGSRVSLIFVTAYSLSLRAKPGGWLMREVIGCVCVHVHIGPCLGGSVESVWAWCNVVFVHVCVHSCMCFLGPV